MVKKLVSVFCICAYFGLAHAQIPQEIWKESEQIEKQIKKTSFPDRVYNIKDFGAKEGNNGEILCHEAINLAILTCSQTRSEEHTSELQSDVCSSDLVRFHHSI